MSEGRERQSDDAQYLTNRDDFAPMGESLNDSTKAATEHLTDAQLDAIEKRARLASLDSSFAYSVSRDDVPALIAEIRRLRDSASNDALAAYRYRHTFTTGPPGPWHYMSHDPRDELKSEDLRASVEVQPLFATATANAENAARGSMESDSLTKHAERIARAAPVAALRGAVFAMEGAISTQGEPHTLEELRAACDAARRVLASYPETNDTTGAP